MKVVYSRYWNRTEELWGSSSTKNLLLLASTLQNMEYRFIIMPRSYSNNFRWCVITHYDHDCTQSSFQFQYPLLIDYDNLF